MKKLIIALAIPCVVLLSLALHNQYLIAFAPEHEFEIEGYDPRDLLSGHYLNFRIKYAVDTKCSGYPNEIDMCVSPELRLINDQNYQDCDRWIRGTCNGGSFRDQLNRFYIPESRGAALEAAVRSGKATVKVAVAKGNAVIKDLLIDGKSWKEIK